MNSRRKESPRILGVTTSRVGTTRRAGRGIPTPQLQQPPVSSPAPATPLATHQIQKPAGIHAPQNAHRPPGPSQQASHAKRPQLRCHHHRNLVRALRTPVLRHPIGHHPHLRRLQWLRALRAPRLSGQWSPLMCARPLDVRRSGVHYGSMRSGPHYAR